MKPALPLPHPLPRLRPWAAALLLACTALAAQARGHWAVELGLGWSAPQFDVGVVLPGSAVSVQFGGLGYRHYGGRWYRPWGARWVVVMPPVGLVLPPDYERPAGEPLPATPSRPEPVLEPQNGQSAEQTEADRRACDRYATQQPAALADASVFHKVVLACMQDRGYKLR